MMPNDFCFVLKRRSSSAQFLPNCNRYDSTNLNSAQTSRPLRRTVRLRAVTQEPIHHEQAGRAEGANVCGRDRKMVRVVAVTSEVPRAFANQAGRLPEVWSALDTLAVKTPL